MLFLFQTSSEYYYATRCLLRYAYNSGPNSTQEKPKLKTKRFKWPKGLNVSSLPSEVDWRTMGAVTSVKDQVSFTNIYIYHIES